MKNLPIVISFEPGAGGRFLQSLLHYIITDYPLSKINNMGAAHDDMYMLSTIQQWALLNLAATRNTTLRYKATAEQKQVTMLRWQFSLDAINTIIHEINTSTTVSDAKINAVANFINSSEYTPVIRTHIINLKALRAINNKLTVPMTLVAITLDTIDDVIAIKFRAFAKNHAKEAFENSKEELSTMLHLTSIRGQSHDQIRSFDCVERENEFFLSFTHIREKNIAYLLAFLQNIAHHCNIQLTSNKIDIITRYIHKYFSMQPTTPLP